MRLLRLLLCSVVLLGAGCGGDDPNAPGNPFLNGTFSARVNNTPFNAVLALVLDFAPLTGVVAGNAAEHTLSFTWEGTTPGTYPIGPDNGSYANLTIGDAEWFAGAGEGSGTVTITTQTADRVVGTFTLLLVPSPGTGATGTRTVSQGSFDLTF